MRSFGTSFVSDATEVRPRKLWICIAEIYLSASIRISPNIIAQSDGLLTEVRAAIVQLVGRSRDIAKMVLGFSMLQFSWIIA